MVIIWLELCTSYSYSSQSPVTTTFIILSSIKIQNGDILVPAYPGCRGNWPLNDILLLLLLWKVALCGKRLYSLIHCQWSTGGRKYFPQNSVNSGRNILSSPLVNAFACAIWCSAVIHHGEGIFLWLNCPTPSRGLRCDHFVGIAQTLEKCTAILVSAWWMFL